jgi:Golgi nucleoside diphosphatase
MYIFAQLYSLASFRAIHAFSFFADQTRLLNISESVTVAQLGKVAAELCATQEHSHVLVIEPHLCLDFVYMHTLLAVGYGLRSDAVLYLSKQINGFETSWALGAGT